MNQSLNEQILKEVDDFLSSPPDDENGGVSIETSRGKFIIKRGGVDHEASNAPETAREAFETFALDFGSRSPSEFAELMIAALTKHNCLVDLINNSEHGLTVVFNNARIHGRIRTDYGVPINCRPFFGALDNSVTDSFMNIDKIVLIARIIDGARVLAAFGDTTEEIDSDVLLNSCQTELGLTLDSMNNLLTLVAEDGGAQQYYRIDANHKFFVYAIASEKNLWVMIKRVIMDA